VFAGNEPEVLDLPLQDVPQSVTMRQFPTGSARCRTTLTMFLMSLLG